MGIRISAVVCTHNRASTLSEALLSLDRQSLNPKWYEVIVVDNASTDNTREAFEAFSRRSNWRYIHDPITGLSHARNTGWQNAEGTHVAFMDDDATANPDWLAKFIEAFDTFQPEPGCIGGRCFPIWETARPEWISDKMLGILSIYHYAEVPTVVNERQGLSGCNIAYPKTVLQSAGGFREDLGRKGQSLRGGEEIFLRHQLDESGYCSVYHPGIQVNHTITAARTTKRWFKENAYWQGVSNAYIDKNFSKRRIKFPGPQLTLRKAGWLLPRLGLLVIATNPVDRFRRQCQYFEAIGYISGLYR
jgi:glucosyl-dolichyl phosphate glucuronosyltransferase